MYAYNDNGTLRLMGSLPSRFRLADGSMNITDLNY